MLCRRVGPSVYDDTKDVIMQGVVTNLERQPMVEPTLSGHVDAEKLAEKLVGGSSKDSSPGTSPTRQVGVAGTGHNGDNSERRQQKRRHAETATLQNGDNH